MIVARLVCSQGMQHLLDLVQNDINRIEKVYRGEGIEDCCSLGL